MAYPSRHERGYGAAWVKLRSAILRRDRHLCQPCQAKGRPTPATEVDHITPKAQGGQDRPDNLQAICTDCHKAKTAAENSASKVSWAADLWPDLPQPSCKVVLITGSPMAGKTTYWRDRITPKDVAIDLDDIAGDELHGGRNALRLRQALKERNKMLNALSLKTDGCAFVVISAPTKEEQEHWREMLNAKHVHLAPPQSRIRSAPLNRRLAYDEYVSKAKKPWLKKNVGANLEIGEDGWPVTPAKVGGRVKG